MPLTSIFCLPSSTRVPTPVGVSTPPRPQPPARMRSTKVPCGIRSTVICLPSICCCAFGFSPIWVPIMRDTCAPSNNLPTPLPGVAASLLIRERPDFFCRTNSSSRRSGVPTPMKPPTMMLAPSGIIATASSAETALMIGLRQQAINLGRKWQ